MDLASSKGIGFLDLKSTPDAGVLVQIEQGIYIVRRSKRNTHDGIPGRLRWEKLFDKGDQQYADISNKIKERYKTEGTHKDLVNNNAEEGIIRRGRNRNKKVLLSSRSSVEISCNEEGNPLVISEENVQANRNDDSSLIIIGEKLHTKDSQFTKHNMKVQHNHKLQKETALKRNNDSIDAEDVLIAIPLDDRRILKLLKNHIHSEIHGRVENLNKIQDTDLTFNIVFRGKLCNRNESKCNTDIDMPIPNKSSSETWNFRETDRCGSIRKPKAEKNEVNGNFDPGESTAQVVIEQKNRKTRDITDKNSDYRRHNREMHNLICQILDETRSPVILCESLLFSPESNKSNNRWEMEKASAMLRPTTPAKEFNHVNLSSEKSCHKGPCASDTKVNNSNKSFKKRYPPSSIFENIKIDSQKSSLESESIYHIDTPPQFKRGFPKTEFDRRGRGEQDHGNVPNSGTGDVIEPKVKVFGNEYVPSFYGQETPECRRKFSNLLKNKWDVSNTGNLLCLKKCLSKPRTKDFGSPFPYTGYSPPVFKENSGPTEAESKKESKKSQMAKLLEEFDIEDQKGIGPVAAFFADCPESQYRNKLFKKESQNFNEIVLKNSSKEKYGIREKEEINYGNFRKKIKDSRFNGLRRGEDLKVKNYQFCRNSSTEQKSLKRSLAFDNLSTLFSDSPAIESRKRNDPEEDKRNVLQFNDYKLDNNRPRAITDILLGDRYPSYINNEHDGVNKGPNYEKMHDKNEDHQEYHTAKENFDNLKWSSFADDMSPMEITCYISPFDDYPRENIPESLQDIYVQLLDLNDFEVESNQKGEPDLIGSGSYGRVYKVTRRGLERDLVLKTYIDPNKETWKEVVEEARVQNYLWDTGFVPECLGIIYSDKCIVPDDIKVTKHALIQECYGKGMTLKKFLEQTNITPSNDDWYNIVYQLVNGLERIHRKHVLLNDIKLDNILIDTGKRNLPIRFIDMGLATFRSGYRYPCRRDSMKKYHYLAPEVRNLELTTTSSDVFSLGKLLLEVNKVARLQKLEPLCLQCVEDHPAKRPLLKMLANKIQNLRKS